MRTAMVMTQAGYCPIPSEDMQDEVEDTDQATLEVAEKPGESASRLVEDVIAELRRSGTSVWDKKGVKTNIWADGDCNERAGGSGDVLILFGSRAEVVAFNLRQLLVLLDLCFVPFVIAFRPIHAVETHWEVQVADFFLTLSFSVLAVPIRLQTSYVSSHSRNEIVYQSHVMKSWLSSWRFWLDIAAIAAAPLLYSRALHDAGLIAHRSFAVFLQGLSVLRLVKCWQLGRPVTRDLLLGSESFVGMLAKVILAFFLIAHNFACLWFWGKMDSPTGLGREWTEWDGWPDQASFEERLHAGIGVRFGEEMDQLWVNYLRSMKDGIYMLTTWNGPDAISDTQLLLSCFLGPTSAVASGIILAQIVEINARFSTLQTQYANKMAMVNAACDGLNLPQELRSRIARYHSYLAFHQADESSKENLFGGLSVQLFAEVKLHCLKDVLVTTAFFEGLPSRLMSFLIVSFEETTFSPGDFVTRKGEIGEMMHIILRGSVAIYVNSPDQILNVLYPGSVFGEVSLLFPFPITARTYAASYAMLMGLTKAKFDYILGECPDEKDILMGRIAKHCSHMARELERLISAEGDEGRIEKAREVLSFVRNTASHRAPEETESKAVSGVHGVVVATASSTTAAVGFDKSDGPDEDVFSLYGDNPGNEEDVGGSGAAPRNSQKSGTIAPGRRRASISLGAMVAGTTSGRMSLGNVPSGLSDPRGMPGFNGECSELGQDDRRRQLSSIEDRLGGLESSVASLGAMMVDIKKMLVTGKERPGSHKKVVRDVYAQDWSDLQSQSSGNHGSPRLARGTSGELKLKELSSPQRRLWKAW